RAWSIDWAPSGSCSRPASSAFWTRSSRSMIFSSTCALAPAPADFTWCTWISAPFTLAAICAVPRVASARWQPAGSATTNAIAIKEVILMSERVGQPPARYPQGGGKAGEQQHPALRPGDAHHGELQLGRRRRLRHRDADRRIGGSARRKAAHRRARHGQAVDVGERVERRLRGRRGLKRALEAVGRRGGAGGKQERD